MRVCGSIKIAGDDVAGEAVGLQGGGESPYSRLNQKARSATGDEPG
jgi:hypothetical protein